VGGFLVASGWLRLVLVSGCFCFPYCFPVLVLSDWTALGLKRATPKGSVCFVFGQTEFLVKLRLTVELAGKYALVGILCLLRHVRWYVGN